MISTNRKSLKLQVGCKRNNKGTIHYLSIYTKELTIKAFFDDKKNRKKNKSTICLSI